MFIPLFHCTHKMRSILTQILELFGPLPFADRKMHCPTEIMNKCDAKNNKMSKKKKMPILDKAIVKNC